MRPVKTYFFGINGSQTWKLNKYLAAPLSLSSCRPDLFKYRRPSLFAGVTFQENTANTKTANTKSKNSLKMGVPFQIFVDKCEKIYTKTKMEKKLIDKID